MDGQEFDKLARSLVDRVTSRRMVAPLAGGFLALLGGAAAVEAGNKKKCKKRLRCGSKCCKDCFVKTNMSDVGPMGKACCPENKVCKKAGFPQQCCYPDEQCRPENDPNDFDGNNGNGLCCRVCGSQCCSPSESCNNGLCEPLGGPARLARRRI